jgi:hypothetical protein
MARTSRLGRIRHMDPARDHQEIVALCACYEFPFDTTRSLEFALFRSYGVPRISALLDATGEFRLRPQKRYDDTDLIVSELMEWGYDSERGRAALRRLNRIHGRHAIENADLLYVLSTFVFEPIRWNERFGWRPLTAAEREAQFLFWREVGRRMGIRDLPPDADAFERFNREYEIRHHRFAAANHRVALATVGLFAAWFPRPLAPLVDACIRALLDDRLLDAVGLRRPSRLVRWAVPAALRARARVLRLLPPRRRPRLRTRMRRRTYPRGYAIADIGPPSPAT